MESLPFFPLDLLNPRKDVDLTALLPIAVYHSPTNLLTSLQGRSQLGRIDADNRECLVELVQRQCPSQEHTCYNAAGSEGER